MAVELSGDDACLSSRVEEGSIPFTVAKPNGAINRLLWWTWSSGFFEIWIAACEAEGAGFDSRRSPHKLSSCGYDVEVAWDLAKVHAGVRFSLPAQTLTVVLSSVNAIKPAIETYGLP